MARGKGARGRGSRSRKSAAALSSSKKDAPPPPATTPTPSRRKTTTPVPESPPPASVSPVYSPPTSQQSSCSSGSRVVMNSSEVLPEMPIDELMKKLRIVATKFQSLKQQERNDEYDELIPFCLHLADEAFLNHASRDVQLLVACCIADILRIFAPEAPFKEPYQIKLIFKFLASQLEGVKNVKDTSFKRYFYLLENLSFVRCFAMCLDLEEEDTQEIFIALFEVIFSSISEDHSEKVKTVMLNLLEPLIVDAHAISYELLDVILKNILKPSKPYRKAANQLAKDLVSRCSENLEPYISSLLSVLLVGNSEECECMSVARRVYELMYQLHQIGPSLLQTALPQLEYKLKSLDPEDRIGAVNLAAKIYSDKDYTTRFINTPLWQVFLGRFNDISVDIRSSLVEQSLHFMLNQPETRRDIEECLKQRAHDSDERVRLEVVKTVVSIASDSNSGFEYVRKNPQLLDCVKERTFDKKLKIRYQALQGLAKIYKMYLDKDCDEGPPSWIHSRILQGYYLEQVEDRTLIERLLNTCLVPYQLDPRERMIQLIYMCSTAESKAYKAYVEVQKNIVLIRRHLADLVNSVRNPTNHQTMALNHRIGVLSKFLPNPAHGSEFIPALIKDMKESRCLLNEMELIVKASSDCKTVRENVNNVLKRLGEPAATNVKYATIKTILERSASVLIDKEAILELLKIVTDLVAGCSQDDLFLGRTFPAPAVLVEKSCTLISVLSFLFSAHFDNSEALDLLMELLLSENLDSKSSSTILSALMFIGKESRPLGQHREDLMSTLANHCLSLLDTGSPRQGKMAVRCLHSNLPDDAAKVALFTHIVEKIQRKLQDPSGPAYATAIVCLGHVAILMPTEFKAILRTLVRNLVKTLLMKPPRTAQDSSKNLDKMWCEEDSLPTSTRCMIYGVKTVARWIVGTQTDLDSSRKAFRLLATIVERGSLESESDPFPFTNSEKAWLRLAAGCGMLKIAQQKKVGDQYQASQICTLAQLMNDGVDQVRFKFAAKLHKGLSRGIPDKCLPLDFLGFYALSAFESNKKQRLILKQNMQIDIKLRREYIKMLMANHPDKDVAAGQLPGLMPDHMLVYAVIILANNPHLTSHDDVEELKDAQRCLQFIVEPLLKSGSSSISFYERLIQGIKNRRNSVDPDDEEANTKMYVICDLLSNLLVKYQRFSSSKEQYPVQPHIPRLYFTKHDDPQWSNTSSYLSQEFLRASAKRKLISTPEPISGAADARPSAKSPARGAASSKRGRGDGDTPKRRSDGDTPKRGRGGGDTAKRRRGGGNTSKRGRGGRQQSGSKRGRNEETEVEKRPVSEINVGPSDAKKTKLQEMNESASTTGNGSEETVNSSSQQQIGNVTPDAGMSRGTNDDERQQEQTVETDESFFEKSDDDGGDKDGALSDEENGPHSPQPPVSPQVLQRPGPSHRFLKARQPTKTTVAAEPVPQRAVTTGKKTAAKGRTSAAAAKKKPPVVRLPIIVKRKK